MPLNSKISGLLPVLAMLWAAADSARADPLDALVRAYPTLLTGHDDRSIFWRGGTKMLVSDGVADKSFEQSLRDASILDQFRLPYPRGPQAQPPAVNADPGRFRSEAFFTKMYGDCAAPGFAANLVSMVWLPKSWGQTIRVTKVNDVAARLKAVSDDIEALPLQDRRAAYPIAGVLACRAVRDTGRRSMHGYAAAIDLNIEFSDYWLWHHPAAGQIPYRNRMPPSIVAAFEKHGFIWGGKWYHYDTMHFEYRPELLIDAEN